MKITIVGTGYVGLVTGTCFAEMGNRVTCVDIDEHKIAGLRAGIMPIFEPGLEDLVKKNVQLGHLHFSTSLAESLDDTPVIFSAVGTPPGENDEADLRYVLEVARTVGRHAKDYFLLVTKSTVPVGTAALVKTILTEELARRGLSDLLFDVASNPEFLKEGAAVKDFMNPDRVVVGVDSERAAEWMTRLYKPFTLNGFPIIMMDIPSAEMTKYAANAMLATRISFMNEMANLCEAVGADVESVRKGIGADDRIGPKFLYAGAGYGGSCFPKDVKALYRTGRQHGLDMTLVEAVEQVNARQKHVVFEKLRHAFGGDLAGKVVAMWGLAFKPETDDMRQAPSLTVIEDLLGAGASVRAFDPVAMEQARRILGERITWCEDLYDAATGADAVALMTEWKPFRMPDWAQVRAAMRGDVMIDGRNIYDAAELKKEGFRYARIGRKLA
jgi:UDPglucose 6-dehydrogenase